MLHTAATIPQMTVAGDAHYHYLTDDIIAAARPGMSTAQSPVR